MNRENVTGDRENGTCDTFNLLRYFKNFKPNKIHQREQDACFYVFNIQPLEPTFTITFYRPDKFTMLFVLKIENIQ